MQEKLSNFYKYYKSQIVLNFYVNNNSFLDRLNLRLYKLYNLAKTSLYMYIEHFNSLSGKRCVVVLYFRISKPLKNCQTIGRFGNNYLIPKKLLIMNIF